MNAAYTEFISLLKKKALNDAIDLAERESLAAGERSEFWLTQLSIALREGGRIDEALEAADRACLLAPRNGWALVARGDALMRKGDERAALAGYNEALVDARAAPRAKKAILACLSGAGTWERVISFLDQADLPAADTFPWWVKALMGLGRNDEALAVCDRWLAEFPETPAALWKKAELQVMAEGIDPVRKRFSRLARIPGKPPVYAEISAWLSKRSGNSEEAAQQYEQLSRQSAGNPSILRKQAFALAKSRHDDRAVPLMEELLRMSPDDMYLHAAYVPACTRLGELERAWKFYHELLVLHPGERGLYGRLKRVGKAMEKVTLEPPR
ncbi:MAG: tetratricopeptide repeat protein [Chitinispirillaceae bacterium]|nr:tetratricopeptide repeat protein [Chitinispirillaceae bacterium]